jgi:membrane protease YdiL (CAAX protease family)
MQKPVAPISPLFSLLLFGIPSAFFWYIAYGLIPQLTGPAALHPAQAWFTGGITIFFPLFLLTLALPILDGYRSFSSLRERLRLRPLSGQDWRIVGFSMLIIGGATGAIMGIAALLHTYAGVPPLQTSPPFMKFEPFTPSERWMLSVWSVMFLFNILGEELLWRGYILPRQEISLGENAWIANAAGWMLFHLCFGPSLMILLLPIIVVLPYAVQKTKNTTVGILIHALLNGPSFIMISLGILQ